ncbi:aminotransferase class I/II-fold pyridoxal phosphate-dependent enzyme [Flavobacteriaceae bacterium F89]|uniref:Aminotransferase class I/II-fold pyridoxal phosphate-dependent enzyme n=1 Tax=Cerina litoralis TaxID=2874477 RepID=A0AAE3EXQ0_9FLAO|nr:GntG family PLP-dependent aldolase [Cerina litoralis]MCG2462039.1 aminotransferase class I/II-fold pyridoxal phosphate-dependent enzyme [Cerina litoralis]
MEINLISDTVTKPTPEMLKAMMIAQVGDDVFKTDPTVTALEEKVASLFGMEAALFFPSGTMANQTAIKLHTQPGEQLICDTYTHVYNYEGGGASFNSGVSCKLVEGTRGMMTANQVEAAINPPDFYHSPLTSLVSIENTTNKGGGACWDLEELRKIRWVCSSHNLAFHLDGARLWNALIAQKESPLEYGKIFDTISVCLSKGLGCPVGSLLVGNKDDMVKAIRIRKIFGGGMRQAGFLAAAGIYALDHHRERLKEDHRRAKEIGEVLGELTFVDYIAPIETNIIIFGIDERKMGVPQFIQKLSEKNILLMGMGKEKLRIVTHLDYTENSHEVFLTELRSLFK